MAREVDIIQRNCRRQAMVSSSIFSADLRRKAKGDIRNEVRGETKDVDSWEIDGCAGGRLATEVEDWLRVEGHGPADGVYPAENKRNYFKKRGRHVGQRFDIVKS